FQRGPDRAAHVPGPGDECSHRSWSLCSWGPADLAFGSDALSTQTKRPRSPFSVFAALGACPAGPVFVAFARGPLGPCLLAGPPELRLRVVAVHRSRSLPRGVKE